MVITPASQAGKGGSIPLTRSDPFIINSPIGQLGIVAIDDTLWSILFIGRRRSVSRGRASNFVKEVARQLTCYFDNPRWVFQLKTHTEATAYQRKVWTYLYKIAVGKTQTYGTVAKNLCSGPRAVARACATNPLPLIVPCHRVVGVSGLCGYGYSGNSRMLDKKQWLLNHEAASIKA